MKEEIDGPCPNRNRQALRVNTLKEWNVKRGLVAPTVGGVSTLLSPYYLKITVDKMQTDPRSGAPETI